VKRSAVVDLGEVGETARGSGDLDVTCDGVERATFGVESFCDGAAVTGGGAAKALGCGLDFGVVDEKLKAGRLAPENGTFGTADFGA
jgi:hypothetical protein